jgi:hypothetical protein
VPFVEYLFPGTMTPAAASPAPTGAPAPAAGAPSPPKAIGQI